jgi:hypothetical protein
MHRFKPTVSVPNSIRDFEISSTSTAVVNASMKLGVGLTAVRMICIREVPGSNFRRTTRYFVVISSNSKRI